MKRGFIARARTTRVTASASERARGRAGSVVSSTTRSALPPSAATAAAKPPTKATSAEPSRMSRPGSSSGVHQQLRRRHPLGEGAARRARPRRRRRRRRCEPAVEIGPPELGPRRPSRRSPAAPPARRRRSRAPSRRSAAAAARPPPAGSPPALSSRAATAATAASISAICVANMSRNSPEIRQVTSTRGRPTAAGGSTSMPVTRAVAVVPDRPAAHQRQPLRDRLAAGPEAGAAPEVDDQRPRPVAMLLHDAGAAPRRPPPCRARRPSASAASADRRRRGCARSAARRSARAPAPRPAPAPRAARRAPRAAPPAPPRRRPAAPARRPARGAAVDVQPVLDREVLEVAEPGVDPDQRRLRDRRPSPTPGLAGEPGLAAPSRRSAAPAGRAAAGRARRPARTRRPAARARAAASLEPRADQRRRQVAERHRARSAAWPAPPRRGWRR